MGFRVLIDFSFIFDSEVLLVWLRCRGQTPFALAKKNGRTKVMGSLRPVPRHLEEVKPSVRFDGLLWKSQPVVMTGVGLARESLFVGNVQNVFLNELPVFCFPMMRCFFRIMSLYFNLTSMRNSGVFLLKMTAIFLQGFFFPKASRRVLPKKRFVTYTWRLTLG